MTSVVTRAVVLKGASEGDKDADEYELINNVRNTSFSFKNISFLGLV